MGKRGAIDQLERRQEDDRGALTRGGWIWFEALPGGGIAVETSTLPRSAEAALSRHGFSFDARTGRFRAELTASEIARRGAVLSVVAAGVDHLREVE